MTKFGNCSEERRQNIRPRPDSNFRRSDSNLVDYQMNTRLDISRNRRDGVTVPTIWVTIALSLLIHAAALWEWFPRVRLLSLERPEWGEAGGPLTVQLVPPSGNRPT